jgi:hypothetical protein
MATYIKEFAATIEFTGLYSQVISENIQTSQAPEEDCLWTYFGLSLSIVTAITL